MSGDKQIKFHQLLENQFNKILQRDFCGKSLTPDVLRELREAIKKQIQSVFTVSQFKLSENAMSWLGDQYFKEIKIDEDQMMTDMVIMNEYLLSDLELNDIKLLLNLFNDTKLGVSINAEMKRRSS
jgi:hypothetical protein